MFAGGSFCGDQPVDLLLRGRELLSPGLLVAGDDRRGAAVVATTAEADEAEVGQEPPSWHVSRHLHQSALDQHKYATDHPRQHRRPGRIHAVQGRNARHTGCGSVAHCQAAPRSASRRCWTQQWNRRDRHDPREHQHGRHSPKRHPDFLLCPRPFVFGSVLVAAPFVVAVRVRARRRPARRIGWAPAGPGRRAATVAPPVLAVGDLSLDVAGRVCRRAGARVDLTPREFAVLELLARRAGQAVSKRICSITRGPTRPRIPTWWRRASAPSARRWTPRSTGSPCRPYGVPATGWWTTVNATEPPTPLVAAFGTSPHGPGRCLDCRRRPGRHRLVGTPRRLPPEHADRHRTGRGTALGPQRPAREREWFPLARAPCRTRSSRPADAPPSPTAEAWRTSIPAPATCCPPRPGKGRPIQSACR
ncbi:hypothetical protein SHIRM173S_04126 [Streptomyces hirsutus]